MATGIKQEMSAEAASGPQRVERAEASVASGRVLGSPFTFKCGLDLLARDLGSGYFFEAQTP